MRVSEIRVNQIRVNQGLGVYSEKVTKDFFLSAQLFLLHDNNSYLPIVIANTNSSLVS